ncbi:MAG: endonuclease/exonuclease/phosphatase family protein, partial [Bacteroidales bacterium]|nr:endonuclease/exonuclease/phosphatase family protein [Bacteroidales bacterium]
DGIQNCSVISNCSLIGRTWRCNNDDLEKTLTNNALIGLWNAKQTYLINDLILIDTNGNSFSPLRGYNETPLQAVTAYYTHYSKDNINIDWSGDHNVKGYWREHTRYGNGSDDATWDEDCWKWSGYYVKDGNTIDGYDKITKSDFTGYLNAECPAFVTWLGSDIDKDQLGNERGINGWWPGAYQSQPGAEPVILQAITWNIRSSDMDDTGDHAWSARRGGMAAFINDRQPQIICMQECESDQRSYLTSNCSGYSAIYDNTSLSWWQQFTGAERSAEVILYKSSAISVQSSGTFWLVSGAPTSPSKASDQNSYRSCTWMKCTYNGQKMLVMDVHLSYRTKNNSTPQSDDVIALRQREMAVIKTWIDGHYNPASDGWLLFMGDMNTSHWEAIFDEWKDGTYGYFSREGFTGGALGRTYNDWDWENGHVATIDFQFYKGFPSVKSYTIPTATYSDVDYLSDHWPVVVEYRMN